MLFRIWFLFACKLGLVGLALAVVGFIADRALPFATTMQYVGLGILIPIGVAGAILGLLLFLRPQLFDCPICGGDATFLLNNRKPSVDCEKCGLVSCKSVEFSFQLISETDHDEIAG